MNKASSIIPNPDFQEIHSILIKANLEDTWSSLKKINIYDSKLIRLLFTLRGLSLSKEIKLKYPTWSIGWNRLFSSGFTPISTIDNKSILMRLNNKMLGNKSEIIQIIWDFILVPHPWGTILSTETRVSFTYKRHRNFFLPYWLIVRLPSGAIRREILRLVRKSIAE